MPFPTPARLSAGVDEPPSSPSAPAPKRNDRSKIERFSQLFDRTACLRCLLISGISIGLGGILFYFLLPTMGVDMLASTLTCHLPGNTPPLLAWLRLCAPRLPVLLLLAAAGLTRFSGGLTTAVLIWRGLSDGGTLYVLFALWTNTAGVDLPLSLPVLLPAAYGLWVIFDLAARTWLSSEARRFALTTSRYGFQPINAEETAQLRFLLLRYLTIFLATISLSLMATGLYTALLCAR